jgi:predicted  nucleic acid-binding Zn-ribbon protein
MSAGAAAEEAERWRKEAQRQTKLVQKLKSEAARPDADSLDRRYEEELIMAKRRESSLNADLEQAHSELKRITQERSELTDKNAQLMKELGAFDLEFFEEIEDLKFKYQQAASRAQEFEVHARSCPALAGRRGEA